jgi:hypothetical protein
MNLFHYVEQKQEMDGKNGLHACVKMKFVNEVFTVIQPLALYAG